LISKAGEEMASDEKKFSIRLNAFLFEIDAANFKALLDSTGRGVKEYDLSAALGIEGKIYVKEREEGRPRWASHLDVLHGSMLPGLTTMSASAVLFVKAKKRVVAFTFGYGRYLLDDAQFALDFGIKTALNTLDNTTLRSVDLYSLEQEPMQKRTQAIRNSNINTFGIDVSRDILKAVTGEARTGVDLETISGGGPQYSFTSKIKDFSELKNIAGLLGDYYDLAIYKNDFGWVDNIQRVQNDSLKSTLDDHLVNDLQKGVPAELQLTLPEIGEWDKIAGFSFTNAKTSIKSMLSASDYFAANPPAGHNIVKLKSNKVFCYDVNENETHYSVYSCLYYELSYKKKIYILFSNSWFAVDEDFLDTINSSLDNVPVSTLLFPEVQKYSKPATGRGKPKLGDFTVESEGDYNQRVSKACGYHLLDKKLIKPRTGASSIELCDLLSHKNEFIHAKHRKGGSAGLSHLFAQGKVAAELLLSDQEFRKGARKRLSGNHKNMIPLRKFDSSLSEIIFLVLGDQSVDVKKNLPFFSKVNLWVTFLSLTQRNFKVSIAGAALSPHVTPLTLASVMPRKTVGKTKTVKPTTSVPPGSTLPISVTAATKP
jgi:uncharacterized protein (TIGR04141 family)